MIQGIALLVGGVVVYALAGSVLSGRLAGCATSRTRCRIRWLLPLAFGGPLALACAGFGIDVVYRQLAVHVLGLPVSALAASSVALVGLLAGGLLLLGVFPRGGGGGGGWGHDDLPPPPDPDGPDGWAAFERGFRAYAAAHDQRRTRVPVG